MEAGMEAAFAEAVSSTSVAFVQPASELTVQCCHHAREIPRSRSHDQVVVVRHQAPSAAVHLVPVTDDGDQPNELLPVVIVEDDGIVGVASGANVVNGAGEIHA